MEASGTVIRRYPGYPEFLTQQDVQDADPVQHPVCRDYPACRRTAESSASTATARR